MKRALVAILLAGCAHLAPSPAREPLPGSGAGLGTYAERSAIFDMVLAQPVDPVRPTFMTVRVTGNVRAASLTLTSTTNPLQLPQDGELCFDGATCSVKIAYNGASNVFTGAFQFVNSGTMLGNLSGMATVATATGAGGFTANTTTGNDGFAIATEGARMRTGPDTYFRENGTRQESSQGVDGTAGSGTGYTTNQTSALGHQIHKITILRTALTAAATTEDETIWTMPAKTRLLRIVGDVTQAFDDAGGPISAMTVMCGTSGGSNVYTPATSVFTVTTVGDVAAEIGANLLSATVADIPSMSATQAIVCRFTSTGGNLSTLTTGSITFYIVHEVLP